MEDATHLLQVQQGASASAVATAAEAAAQMLQGVMSMMHGAIHGDDRGEGVLSPYHHLALGKASIMEGGSAGCSWRTDLQASWNHASKMFPAVQHGLLTAMVPRLIERQQKKAQSGGEASDDEEGGVAQLGSLKTEIKQVITPLKAEMVPPECDKHLIKSKIVSQSIAGGDGAEEAAARCMMQATGVTAPCARCAGRWLNGFMGRGLRGLAQSCVPKCSPANDACKKGMMEQCIGKSYPCMKCMKPGLLELAGCMGINATRFQLSNKLDLYAKAFREGGTEGEALDRLINGIVLAWNA